MSLSTETVQQYVTMYVSLEVNFQLVILKSASLNSIIPISGVSLFPEQSEVKKRKSGQTRVFLRPLYREV